MQRIYELETHGSARMWCNDLESNGPEPARVKFRVTFRSRSRGINLVVQIFNGRNDSKPIVADRYFEEQPSPPPFRYILPVLILKSGCNGRDYNAFDALILRERKTESSESPPHSIRTSPRIFSLFCSLALVRR